MPNTPPQLVRTASGAGWTNPSFITASSSVNRARFVVPHSGISPQLIGTNCGFAIPSSSIISGVIVSAVAQTDDVDVLGFSGIQLVHGGAPIGTGKGDVANWTTAQKQFSYGTGVDLWGAALTPAIVNDSTFGFYTTVSNSDVVDSHTAFVNAYTMQVFYSFGSGQSSNGGIPSPLNMVLIPAMIQINQFSFFTLDPTNFNDPNSGGFYNWKVEDGIAGRTLTVNRVILSYRDLGVAKIMLALSGVTGPTDPLQPNTPVSSVSPLITIGTTKATGKICTLIYGLSLSAANLQLSAIRAANGGPISITKARLEGKVETTTY